MPVFNAFESTNPRLKKNKAFSEGATAGAAKVSRGGPRGREELKSLGERMGWTASELLMQEINAMSADETLWHQMYNVDHWRDAFEREEARRTNKLHMGIWDVRRMWNGRASPEESEAAQKAGDLFARQHPTFERTIENAEKMIAYMAQNDLDGTRVESYTKAFDSLVEQGQLVLAKPESADEFLRNHPELHDRRTPPLIAARHQREENTETHFAKSAAATSEGSVTRVVDYGQQKHGVPPESEKYSFKMKVSAMSADELAQRCADDPTFQKALDEFK